MSIATVHHPKKHRYRQLPYAELPAAVEPIPLCLHDQKNLREGTTKKIHFTKSLTKLFSGSCVLRRNGIILRSEVVVVFCYTYRCQFNQTSFLTAAPLKKLQSVERGQRPQKRRCVSCAVLRLMRAFSSKITST